MSDSGCGKRTNGKLLTDGLGLPLYDAADFHADSNSRKMNARIPFIEADRFPWLSILYAKLDLDNIHGKSS